MAEAWEFDDPVETKIAYCDRCLEGGFGCSFTGFENRFYFICERCIRACLRSIERTRDGGVSGVEEK